MAKLFGFEEYKEANQCDECGFIGAGIEQLEDCKLCSDCAEKERLASLEGLYDFAPDASDKW